MADEPFRPRFYLRGRPALDPDLTWGQVTRYHRWAEVAQTEWLTETGTVRITFRVTDDEPFNFVPGQFITLEEEIPDLGPRRSLYCIYSPPAGDRRFTLLIRVLPDGYLSGHLASLEPGDTINFRGPSGRSMVPKDPDAELIMLATGVGISPFYSLLRHLAAQGERRRVRLYWGLRLTDDICLLDELDALARGPLDFRYHISLTQPPLGWPDLRGRVSESVPPRLKTLGGKDFYLCGNGIMVEEMGLALRSLGVDRTHIHQERFFNLGHRPDPPVVRAIMARFVATDIVSLTNLMLRVTPQADADTG
ncbi:MAG: FAD-binding oxidoreductase [Actinomycetota bacterium]|nr:FAD-binding oxidoreductase [Actinomycetota bacterium]